MIDVIEKQEDLAGLFNILVNEKAEIESFHSRYEVKEELGKGLTSVVCRCVDKFTGKQFAVKIVNLFQNLDINVIESVDSEVSTLTAFPPHPNIISLVNVFRSEANVYIVLELAPNGELFDFCNKHVCLTERFAAILARQLFLAVNHLHQHSIVHRDIKMENLLMDERRKLKLTDFGFAKVLKEGEMLHDLCGTLSYIAPEIIKAEMGLNTEGYSFSADMWSCGILLYTLLVGQPPFYHRKKIQLMRKIQSCIYDKTSESWTRLSPEAKDLVESLLVLDVSRRLSAAEALQHPWIKKSEFKVEEGRKKSFKPVAYLVWFLVAVKRACLELTDKTNFILEKGVVMVNPYRIKEIRRTIDDVSFQIYGHWIQREDPISRSVMFQQYRKSKQRNTDSATLGTPSPDIA